MRQAVAQALEGAGKVVIISHQDPDGDALGSTLGLAHMLRAMGKDALAYSAGPIPEEYRFLPGLDGLAPLPDPGQVDLAVLLDCHEPKRTGPEAQAWLARAGAAVVVDHHEGEAAFGTAWVAPEHAATSQMLAELAQERGWPLGPEAAQCLFVGVQTDTGSFRYANTTPRVLRTAAALVAAGAKPWDASQEVYATRPKRLKLLGRIMDGLETHAGGLLAYAQVTAEDFAATGTAVEDLENVVEALRGIPGVEVGILLRQEDGGIIKGSLRARGRVDVAQVALDLGGGGHKNAAGFKLQGQLSQVRQRVLELVAPLVEAVRG